MDHQRVRWMKEEEADDVHNERGSTFLADPLKIEVPSLRTKQDPKLEPQVDSSENNVPEDPLNIEEPGVHVKRDPELKLHEHHSYITVTMDHQRTIRMKKEEEDDVPIEPGSMVPEDPLRIEEPSVHVKRETELKHNEDNFLLGPWGISLSTDFIKEDPAGHLEEDETEITALTSRRCVSSSTRLNQFSSGSCVVSFEEIVDEEIVHSELEKGAEEPTHLNMFSTHRQGLTEQEEEEEEYSLFGTILKCSSREKEFSKFSCSICLQSFPTKYRLIMHVFVHIDGVQPPMYVCRSCGEVFLSDVSMNKHLQMNEDDQVKATCHNDTSECIYNYENMFLKGDEVSVTEQMRKQPSTKVTRKISKKPFSDKHNTHTGTRTAEKRDSHDGKGSSSTTRNVSDHIVPLTAERPHKCDACGKSFTFPSVLKNHSLIHTGLKRHKCDICGMCFTQLFTLKRHSLIHNGIKAHKCEICGKSFTRLDVLKKHGLIHTGIKAHKCVICGKTFTQLGTLKSHALLHTGIKAHKCDICGKSFTGLGYLKRHGIVHTGIKAHKCEICGKCFTHLGGLKVHALIHTGIKAHKCDICGKSFTWLGDLTRHGIVHTGIKAHKCEICGKCFTHLGVLKEHALIHIGIRPHK